jgi:hypothetical protein
VQEKRREEKRREEKRREEEAQLVLLLVHKSKTTIYP